MSKGENMVERAKTATAKHLVDLLLKYGQHDGRCSSHFGPECYCGWEEVKRDMSALRTILSKPNEEGEGK